MTRDRQKVLWPALLTALLVVTAFTLAASSKIRRSKTSGTKITAHQDHQNPASASRRSYVRRAVLSPKLVWNLKALGDRLEGPGKERLRVTAQLTQSAESLPTEVVAVLEFPERLSLTIQKGVQARVITFDGEQAKFLGNPLAIPERDLIETLVYGTAEHFFMTQMRGQATRFLGGGFRTDDGSNTKYNGPYYDIYQVADQIKTSVDQRVQEKLYYFNSETLLLEKVTYKINRDGREVTVDEVTGGWAKEQGQQVARQIERFENGKSVFVLTVLSAELSPRVDDRIF